MILKRSSLAFQRTSQKNLTILMTTSPQIEQTLKILQQHFSNSLVAVYLYGSSVSGGLKPTSDIDILAVIENTVDKETRKRLIHDLMCVSGLYPIDPEDRRPLEVAIFQHKKSQFILIQRNVSLFMGNGYGMILKEESSVTHLKTPNLR